MSSSEPSISASTARVRLDVAAAPAVRCRMPATASSSPMAAYSSSSWPHAACAASALAAARGGQRLCAVRLSALTKRLKRSSCWLAVPAVAGMVGTPAGEEHHADAGAPSAARAPPAACSSSSDGGGCASSPLAMPPDEAYSACSSSWMPPAYAIVASAEAPMRRGAMVPNAAAGRAVPALRATSSESAADARRCSRLSAGVTELRAAAAVQPPPPPPPAPPPAAAACSAAVMRPSCPRTTARVTSCAAGALPPPAPPALADGVGARARGAARGRLPRPPAATSCSSSKPSYASWNSAANSCDARGASASHSCCSARTTSPTVNWMSGTSPARYERSMCTPRPRAPRSAAAALTAVSLRAVASPPQSLPAAAASIAGVAALKLLLSACSTPRPPDTRMGRKDWKRSWCAAVAVPGGAAGACDAAATPIGRAADGAAPGPPPAADVCEAAPLAADALAAAARPPLNAAGLCRSSQSA